MNMEELSSKVKEIFSRSTQASKEALEKAGDKVQDFTDKSVTKIEIRKLETQRDCKYEEMGLKLSQMLLQGASITCENVEDIKSDHHHHAKHDQKGLTAFALIKTWSFLFHKLPLQSFALLFSSSITLPPLFENVNIFLSNYNKLFSQKKSALFQALFIL